MDKVDPQTRSRVMAAVRSSGNRSTEIAMIRLFRQHRITGWRRHWPLTGKPDFAWPKQQVALFVDGCFWHGCPEHCRMPEANNAYWVKKVAGNQRRDKKVSRKLRQDGWQVLRIWEHEVKANPVKAAMRIRSLLDKPISAGHKKGAQRLPENRSALKLEAAPKWRREPTEKRETDGI